MNKYLTGSKQKKLQLSLRFCEFCSRRRRKKKGFQDVFYCLKRTLKTIFHASLEIHCVDADLPIKSLHNFLNSPMGPFNNYGDKKRGWGQ